MTADLLAVQRTVADALTRGCKAYNGKRPIIKVIAHEYDPRRATRRSAANGVVCMCSLTFRRINSAKVSACYLRAGPALLWQHCTNGGQLRCGSAQAVLHGAAEPADKRQGTGALWCACHNLATPLPTRAQCHEPLAADATASGPVSTE